MHIKEVLDTLQSPCPGLLAGMHVFAKAGRNAADTWNSLQTLQDYGMELCCVKDGIDSGTSMGKAMLSIAAVFAEMERDNIRTQTMSGREEKARKGYWNGGQAPFGYRLADKGNKFKELEVDEDEAKVVRRTFEMYAYENKGSMAIAAWLNNHGIRKTPRGNARMDTFSSETVQRMITNTVYIGKIAYGRRRTETIEGTRGKTTWAYYCPHTVDEIDLALAKRVRNIRRRRSISQQRLAEMSNVSLGSIKRFESTGKISLLSLTKIAQALDTVDDIKQLFTQVPYLSIEEVINEQRQ